MSDKIKCFQCNFETDDIKKYRAHRADHASGKIPKKVPIKPTSIGPMEMPDELAGRLLPKIEQKEEVEMKESEKPIKKPPKPVKKPEPIKNEKIKLTYKYVGRCDQCGEEVTTLDIDIDKYVVMAYCMKCKRQIMQRPVKKL